MVELAVELLELVETQLRDRRRVSTTIHSISVVRKQGLLRGPSHQRVRRTVHSFHLVVDDSTIR